jgi:protein-L-isoaspartate(D-aspartate) O-methyltransferase
MPTDPFAEPRQRMLAVIAAKTIYACARLDKAALAPRVMEVMGRVPRHEFVPPEWRVDAYADSPLPIGCDKTISQPFIVAVMTDLLDLQPSDTVLEVGTGLGYQTAVLAELAHRVFTVELIAELAGQARQRLTRLGHLNVEFRVGDGRLGWPERAPFDKVLVAAAPEVIPPALIEQLKPGGRMVIPAGPPDEQRLMLLQKDRAGSVSMKAIFAVRFSRLDRIAPG